jgi:hypothetical protein
VALPQVIDPTILADHRRTRTYLMRACLECRRNLGLDVPPDTETRKAADAHQINP